MKEYDEKTALATMFDMQESLQNMLNAKRNTISPDYWNKDIPDKHRTMAIQSGYYMLSTVTEIFEFFEQLEKDHGEFTDLVKFELIDAWHFLMNQLLYLNIKPNHDIKWFYDKASENYAKRDLFERNLHEIVGELAEAMGEVYQNTSYKTWKTYIEPKEDPLKLAVLCEAVLVKFFELFIGINMKPEDIWKFYYEKNKENFHRQESGGRYEK